MHMEVHKQDSGQYLRLLEPTGFTEKAGSFSRAEDYYYYYPVVVVVVVRNGYFLGAWLKWLISWFPFLHFVQTIAFSHNR